MSDASEPEQDTSRSMFSNMLDSSGLDFTWDKNSFISGLLSANENNQDQNP